MGNDAPAQKTGDNNGGKSIKGKISLIFAVLCIVLIVLAVIPMENIRNTGVMLSGWLNVVFGTAALVCAVSALIFGSLSKKNKTRSRAGTAGLLIGAFALIVSIAVSAGTCTVSLVSDYANHGDNSFLGKNVRDDAEKRESLEGFIGQIITGK